MRSKLQRNYSFDFIRALATILVLVIHVASEFTDSTTSFSGSTWWIAIIVQSGAKVAVPLFVMLSGALLLTQQRRYSLTEFYKRRLVKVGIPALSWSLIYYFLFLVLDKKVFALGKFVKDYVFLGTFYHLYFLFIILGLYWLSPFLQTTFQSLRQKDKYFITTCTLTFSGILSLLIYHYPQSVNLWSIFTIWILFVGYFLAGAVLSGLSITKHKWYWLVLVVVTSILTTAGGKTYAQTTDLNPWLRYFEDVFSLPMMIASLSSFVVLLHLPQLYPALRSPKIKSLVASISEVSFGVYIIHPLLLYFMNKNQLLNIFFDSHSSLFVILSKVIILFGFSYLATTVMRTNKLFKILLGG